MIKKQRPLTEGQTELLEAMKRGVTVTYYPYMGRFQPYPYYKRSDTNARCTTTATSLLHRGLVVIAEKTRHGHILAVKQN